MRDLHRWMARGRVLDLLFPKAPRSTSRGETISGYVYFFFIILYCYSYFISLVL